MRNLTKVLSPVHFTWTTVFRRARLTGSDPYGNNYYEAKPVSGYKRSRRWVIYKSEPESGKIPPEWHGWLHHQTDHFPSDEESSFRREWQKPHVPDLTGTDGAYRPPGSVLSKGNRGRAPGDYEPWEPPQ